jgi:hypothetical protein
VTWLPWNFAVRPEAAVQTDPFEEEFFIGPSESELDGGHVDSLVRESIQNALDARVGSEAVRVKFAIHEEPVAEADIGRYLNGLRPHLDALKVPWPGVGLARWLVYEDFATSGLGGDPSIIDDPPANHDRREDFYWFWRNVGRSAKTGEKLGRWGLGKTVFPSSSQINTIIGLTQRADDRRTLVMGQAVLRNHVIGNVRHLPYGLMHDPEHPGPTPMPLQGEDEAVRLRHVFHVDRKEETGLSLIVPFLRPGIRADLIARSACVHFFVRILRGDLIVETVDEDGKRWHIDKDNLHATVKTFTWDGPASAKLAAPPPLELAEWAIQCRQKDQWDATLAPAGTNGNAIWSTNVVPRSLAASLAQKLKAGDQRIAVRVPLVLERIDGEKVDTSFDVFLRRSESGRGDAWHVRDGMTITAVGTGRPAGGELDGLMLVSDKTLSGFLGDAEGPAHVDWSTEEKRLSKNWQTYRKRLHFIRGAITKLADLLRESEPKPAPVALAKVFSVSVPSGKEGVEPPTPPTTINAKKTWFTVDRTAQGFCVKSDPKAPRPDGVNLRVAFAYDVAAGDPFRKWNPLDFEIRLDHASTLKLGGYEVKVHRLAGNEVLLAIQKEPFRFAINGFDSVRDVVVRVEPVVSQIPSSDECVDL